MTGRIELDFSVSTSHTTSVAAPEIWDALEETGSIGAVTPGRSVQLTGAISFKLDGQEILGPEYWVELFNLIHLSPLVAGTYLALEQQVVTNGLSGAMLFERRPDGTARYSLEVKKPSATDALAKQVVCTRGMPLQPLADAWTYLWFRVQRLAAELGDEPSISATRSREAYFPAGYFDHVDRSLIEFALEAPLEDVLSTPKSFG